MPTHSAPLEGKAEGRGRGGKGSGVGTPAAPVAPGSAPAGGNFECV